MPDTRGDGHRFEPHRGFFQGCTAEHSRQSGVDGTAFGSAAARSTVPTVSETFSFPPGGGSSEAGGGDRGAGDPVSWLQIEQGWSVVASDGLVVGTVAAIEGDKHDDIFDGLAVETGSQTRYLPGEQVGQIFSGRVMLRIASSEVSALDPFRAPPPETRWTPGKAPLSARLSNWFRGKR